RIDHCPIQLTDNHHDPPSLPTRRSSDLDILGARGIRLDALVTAKVFHLLAALIAEEILDRVEDRARMRLDGNAVLGTQRVEIEGDRKSTRLNSSHVKSSYAVFCLKKKMN